MHDREIRLVLPEWMPEFEITESSLLKSGLLFLLLKDPGTQGFGGPLGGIVLAKAHRRRTLLNNHVAQHLPGVA